MSALRFATNSVLNGMLVALIAPPIAGLSFVIATAHLIAKESEKFDASFSGIFLFAIGIALGSYVVGIVPSFLAGLLLPVVQRFLPPLHSSVLTAFAGVFIYSNTTGTSFLSSTKVLDSFLTSALPAFIGVAVAAYIATKISKRHAEA